MATNFVTKLVKFFSATGDKAFFVSFRAIELSVVHGDWVAESDLHSFKNALGPQKSMPSRHTSTAGWRSWETHRRVRRQLAMRSRAASSVPTPQSTWIFPTWRSREPIPELNLRLSVAARSSGDAVDGSGQSCGERQQSTATMAFGMTQVQSSPRHLTNWSIVV